MKLLKIKVVCYFAMLLCYATLYVSLFTAVKIIFNNFLQQSMSRCVH